MSAPTTTHKPHKGKKEAKAGEGKNYYTAKGRAVGGKGIFVTCVRGKESRCVGEMYDLLDEIADRIYPPERLEELNKLRAHRQVKEGDIQMADGDASESDEDMDDSIEASIAKELAELKEHGARNRKGKGKDDGKPKGPKPRFVSVQTNTECLCFFATSWPYDPVELTQAIIEDVQQTGITRTRYTQRLSPMVTSCHALNVEQVERDSQVYIETAIRDWVAKTGKTQLTYYIDPSLRCHIQPLTRDYLLKVLGAQVVALSTPSPSSTLPALSVSVSSSAPDLVLLPTVLRNVYGLSVVEGRVWNDKRFNVEQVGLNARRRLEREREAREGTTEVAGVRTEQA